MILDVQLIRLCSKAIKDRAKRIYKLPNLIWLSPLIEKERVVQNTESLLKSLFLILGGMVANARSKNYSTHHTSLSGSKSYLQMIQFNAKATFNEKIESSNKKYVKNS